MEKYTIYCTEEQTKKAFELGAPIKKEASSLSLYGCVRLEEKDSITGTPYWLMPVTAEQMICWLEEQEPIKEISIYRYERLTRRYWCYEIFGEKGCYLPTDEECSGEGYSSRKEATLNAIDAALNYLAPIPITPEILEKNGIKKKGDEYVIFGWEGAKQWYVALEDFKPQFDFWLITSSDRDLNVKGKIRYVHELRHVLRLCGLNDLADNFKTE